MPEMKKPCPYSLGWNGVMMNAGNRERLNELKKKYAPFKISKQAIIRAGIKVLEESTEAEKLLIAAQGECIIEKYERTIEHIKGGGLLKQHGKHD